MINAELVVRDFRCSDIPDLIDLAHTGLGTRWTEASVRWKYYQNPAGEVFGSCAERSGRCLGFYGNIPVRVKLGKREILGAQAVDAVVREDARRSGTFVKLATDSYRKMDELGVELAYALPNPISKEAFLKRLSWVPLGEIPRYTLILDPRAILAGGGTKPPRKYLHRLLLECARLTAKQRTPRLSDLCVRRASEFDERTDRLWDEAGRRFEVAVVRNRAYLNWRYVTNPQRRYTILLAEKGGELCGLLVLTGPFGRTGAAGILEFLFRPESLDAGSALLQHAVHLSRASKASQVHCWMLPQHLDYLSLLRQNGFLFRPIPALRQFLAYTTPLILRVNSEVPSANTQHFGLSDWFVTMGDHDYY